MVTMLMSMFWDFLNSLQYTIVYNVTFWIVLHILYHEVRDEQICSAETFAWSPSWKAVKFSFYSNKEWPTAGWSIGTLAFVLAV